MKCIKKLTEKKKPKQIHVDVLHCAFISTFIFIYLLISTYVIFLSFISVGHHHNADPPGLQSWVKYDLKVIFVWDLCVVASL